MDKKTYYITVGAGEPGERADDNGYEFEIEATQADINQLQALFEQAADSAPSLSITSGSPTPSAAAPGNTAKSDFREPNPSNMRQVYNLIHRLGSPETRQLIESLNMLH